MKKLLIILALFSNVIFAQTDDRMLRGSNKVLFTQGTEAPQCFVYDKYIVKTNRDEAIGGETVMAYNRLGDAPPEESCRTKGQPIISLVGNYSGKNTGIDEDITSYFQGIFGKYLFIDKTVEPFVGAFEIFDLTTGKSVFQSEYYPDMKILPNQVVFYETWSVKDGLLKNCKEAKQIKKRGLGIGWVDKFNLNLKTMKAKKIGQRCEPMQ